jgi:GT2 family glycosyltransferase
MTIVSIIIPIFNGIEDTLNCLKSLKSLIYPKELLEIIVVNNASTDKSVIEIEKKFPEIKIINLKKNLGFAKAINEGIKKAKSNYYFIINNDIIFDKKFLSILMRYLNNHKNVGIVGGKIYSHKSKHKPIFTGVTFNPWTGAIKQLPNTSKIKESEWIQGCAMLIKKQVTDVIGLFDPGYFFSYEDTEFCLKARKAGFKVIYIPKAKAWHKENATIDKLGQKRKGFELYKAKYRYIFKNYSILQIISISIFQFFFISPIRLFIIRKPPFYFKSLLNGYIYNLQRLSLIKKSR